MEPALIGAAIGGGGAAITGKNPFQGALLGGLTGGIGGAMSSSTSPFSLGSILNGIGTNFAAGGDPVKGAAMNAAALASSGGGGISGGGVGSGASGFPINPELSGNSVLGSETLGGVWKDITAANDWMNQNPITAQLGFKTAENLMQEPQVHFSQPGQVSRGQIPQMDYSSLLNPQQQTVLRPQAMSLL